MHFYVITRKNLGSYEKIVSEKKRLGNTAITGGVQRSGGFLLPRAGTQ